MLYMEKKGASITSKEVDPELGLLHAYDKTEKEVMVVQKEPLQWKTEADDKIEKEVVVVQHTGVAWATCCAASTTLL